MQTGNKVQTVHCVIPIPTQKPWSRPMLKLVEGKIQDGCCSSFGIGMNFPFRIAVNHGTGDPRGTCVERSELDPACFVEVRWPGYGWHSAGHSRGKSNPSILACLAVSASGSHGGPGQHVLERRSQGSETGGQLASTCLAKMRLTDGQNIGFDLGQNGLLPI